MTRRKKRPFKRLGAGSPVRKGPGRRKMGIIPFCLARLKGARFIE